MNAMMRSKKLKIILSPLLLPASAIYSIIIYARNLLYDLGLLHVVQLNTPVISVGNIAAGGSGKSPFTVWLANELQNKGMKIAILSRGYGRSGSDLVVVSSGEGPLVASERGGDEPVMMSHLSKGIPIVVDANRIRGGKYLEKEFSPDCIILDDAMQHRRIHRDIDIVLWNCNQSKIDLFLLPFGHQRDLKLRLRKSDFLILTKAGDQSEKEKWEYLNRWHSIDGVFHFALQKPENLENGDLPNLHPETKVLVIAGIAFPEVFLTQLQNIYPGISMQLLALPDHFKYDDAFVGKLKSDFSDINYIITTAKDYVKLQSYNIKNILVSRQKITQMDSPSIAERVYKKIKGS